MTASSASIASLGSLSASFPTNKNKKRNDNIASRVICRSSQVESGVDAQTSGASSAVAAPQVPMHKVTVHDTHRGVVHHFQVPEDQYILHYAESQDITLPFACRHGCCTSCAVRIKSGEIRQPEALGISAELKAKGYALLCVGYPSSDLEVETQDEDEVYWLQFGRYFARGPIERDITRWSWQWLTSKLAIASYQLR